MIMTVGKSVHYCLGSPFSRLESEIALNGLFQRFPDLALDTALIEPNSVDWGGWISLPLIHGDTFASPHTRSNSWRYKPAISGLWMISVFS